MKKEIGEKILHQTEADYNLIAQDFDQTRGYLWPGLKEFKTFVKDGDQVLDLGCGNGKLRLLFKDVKLNYTGVDQAQKLLDIAQNRQDFKLENQKFIQANVAKLPLPDNSFDVVFFIAVFHHLPGRDLREQTVQEIKRVLKPGGILIMTNWNRYQKEFLPHVINYTFLKLIGKSEMDFKDIYLPWQRGKTYRYYHAFTLGELRKIIKSSGLSLEKNYLAELSGRPVSKFDYLTAANLVTVAKKC